MPRTDYKVHVPIPLSPNSEMIFTLPDTPREKFWRITEARLSSPERVSADLQSGGVTIATLVSGEDPFGPNAGLYGDGVNPLRLVFHPVKKKTEATVFIAGHLETLAEFIGLGDEEQLAANGTADSGFLFLSASELAKTVGQPIDAVESFLRRYRQKSPDCFMPTDSPRRNEPKYLYRTAEVLPELKKNFTSGPSK